MKQSRTMSLVEAVTNVIVGFVLAVATQMAIFPVFGLAVTLPQNMVIGSVFAAVSVVRRNLLRRLFERLRMAGV